MPLDGLDSYQRRAGVERRAAPAAPRSRRRHPHACEQRALSRASSRRCRCCTLSASCSCHDLFVIDLAAVRDGFFGPGKYDGSVVNWVNGPLLAARRRPARLRRPASRPFNATGRAHPTVRDHDAARRGDLTPRLSRCRARPCQLLATHRRRLLLGARVARAPEDRLLPAPASAAPTSRRSTRSRSRRRSRTRSSAGVDIVSDGELRRDNDIDYFLARIPGVEIAAADQAVLLRLLPGRRAHPLPGATTPSAARPGRRLPLHPRSTPTSRSSSPSPARSRCPAGSRTMPTQTARPGHGAWPACSTARPQRWSQPAPRVLQIDEPFLAGYPEHVDLADRGAQRRRSRASTAELGPCTSATATATPGRCGRVTTTSSSRPCSRRRIDQLVLEFARKGYDDLDLFEPLRLATVSLGLGVIDVKSRQRRDAGAGRQSRSAGRSRCLPPDRLIVNPDCGLRHLPTDIARAKLRRDGRGARRAGRAARRPGAAAHHATGA